MAKNGLKTNQMKESNALEAAKANGKAACYRSVATAAVKEAQRDNRERNIANWYLVNGELVSDRGTSAKKVSAKAALVKTVARAAAKSSVAGKRAKSIK